MIAVAAGAALIFGAECVTYLATTGNPLFRLTATSGLGAAVGSDLQIAEIWRWDAYLRSLLLLPVQVGLMWWLSIPAAWMAWRVRRRAPGIAFATVLFLIVMVYLQFGSGSLSSYAPLPKTPRYTALATPMLMLAVGAWLAGLFARAAANRDCRVGGRRDAVAIPCLLYLAVSTQERTRNTLAVVPVLKTLGPGAAAHRLLHRARAAPRRARSRDPRLVSREVRRAPDDGARATAAGRVCAARSAGSEGLHVLLPTGVAGRGCAAAGRRHDASGRARAYEPGAMTRRLLEGIRGAALRLPDGNPLRDHVNRSVSDMIEGDDAVLYRLPSP